MRIYKRLKNRKIYCCTDKTYVEYSNIKAHLQAGAKIRVFESKTTKEVTNYVLRQIVRYDEELNNDKLMDFLANS